MPCVCDRLCYGVVQSCVSLSQPVSRHLDLGDPPSPLGDTAWGSWVHSPGHWSQVCPHLCLQLFCSSLNFLLLGNEPTHPKGDSIYSRGLWVPEEHPDNMPDKGIVLLIPGNPNYLVPMVLADVLLQQHRRRGKLCGYTSLCVADIQDSMASPRS